MSAKKAKSFTLAHGMAASFFLHALPVLLWSAAAVFLVGAVQRPSNQTLQIDLFGMLSDRQQEERVALEEIPERPAEPVPELPPPPKEEIPEPLPPPEAVPVKEEAPPPPKPKPKPAPQRARAAQEAQKQKTIKSDKVEVSVLRQYLATLSRVIR
ncbi:MAG: hypothetical protein LBK52_05390, partial [Deltaproteobacteria bacterium]|nr:hypothetical protein [Deltaproteobacteria bacterium]